MNDFLDKLEKSLKGMGGAEKQEIIADYREHFEIGLEAGKTQEQIEKQLGEPVEIAKMYSALGAVEKAHRSKGVKDTLSMIGAIISYKIGGGLVMAMLYFAAVCTMICLFGTAIGLTVGFGAGFGLAVMEFVAGYTAYGLLALCTGLVLGAGGVLGIIGCTKLWKATVGNLSHVARKIMQRKRAASYEY